MAETSKKDEAATPTAQPVVVNGAPEDSKPEADAAPTENPSRPLMKNLKGVKYSGIADRKIFSVEDLKALGAVDPQTDLEWNAKNDFTVLDTDVNASTVDALIKLPEFKAI
jgi:hypothetical protein